ncbi:MAG TPA: hypothetical protein VN735_00585 [Steroidobacteraceae bacterium]|nr:hypothetical protein [Steroidobacteraceae bacterium]
MQKELRRTALRLGATRARNASSMIGAIAALWAILPIGNAAAQARQSALSAGLPTVSLSGPCLASGKAYLRASIRGAVRLDVDLRGAELTCEGGPRFDGSGILMSFEGSVGPQKRRVRMVFGIGGAKEGRPGKELPTNLTVIFEGEKLLFATQGGGNCTVDRLTQTHITDRHSTRAYRIVAHGFCIAPANDLAGHARILVTTFDFAGRADFNAA